jgi:hypothetical protein
VSSTRAFYPDLRLHIHQVVDPVVHPCFPSRPTGGTLVNDDRDDQLRPPGGDLRDAPLRPRHADSSPGAAYLTTCARAI